MSGVPRETFSPSWLRLRERYDRAARSKALAQAFLDALPRQARVADLACGGGANANYLASLGRPDLRWLLIDADPVLLQLAAGRVPVLETRCTDLARPRRGLAREGIHGATASALCDLVSGAWLDRFIGEAARQRLPLLFALTVDGRMAFSPGDPEDAAMFRRFRADQRRDKGFGPALGPRAPARLAATLHSHGYHVRLARSDWRLGAGDGGLLDALLQGIADAARAGGSASASPVDRWLERRRAQIAERRLAAVVGHVDILALPRSVAARGRSRRVNLP